MPSTFINPTLNPDARLGVSSFDETSPLEWSAHASEAELELVIRAVYKQVLGNAYVMESERLTVPESQLRQGKITLRGFVREVAKSELYRSRFFENCPRYRAIELNFKHLLGRAPESYDETADHSHILDTQGFEAEIDSYIYSEEYLNAFGETIVPFYRGHKTQTGKKMVGFTYLFQLLRGPSASDKASLKGAAPHLNNAILTNQPATVFRPSGASADGFSTNVNLLLAQVLQPQSNPDGASATAQPSPYQGLIHEQQTELVRLRQQLAELQPFAAIGSAQTSKWQTGGTGIAAPAETDWQTKSQQQANEIATLKSQIADARRLATIGEARLNKWRSRVFNG
jgi:phycoerythrin-associated linker protein